MNDAKRESYVATGVEVFLTPQGEEPVYYYDVMSSFPVAMTLQAPPGEADEEADEEADGPPLLIDVEGHLQHLESGDGEPWPPKKGPGER